MSNITVGSLCSGIEAASVAWADLPYKFKWFSEISGFQSELLKNKYPGTPNLGDMQSIAGKLKANAIEAPDLICGGTPCQAFSLAGLKKGLDDSRGNLTLSYVEIIKANDDVRLSLGKPRTIALWENVEGVLRDKTNAFGCLLGSLSGLDQEIKLNGKWPQSGILEGPTRNIAWRILDAKYFGVPQQRRRLYLVAGGKDFDPVSALFEITSRIPKEASPQTKVLKFKKSGHTFEVFREYTDCIYSAYGTKWNGNAAAYNGSLYVAQDKRIRRLTPLECERLMGFPDNYTDLPRAKPTARYQAVGNSWAIPVVQWIGKRIKTGKKRSFENHISRLPDDLLVHNQYDVKIWSIGANPIQLRDRKFINGAVYPEVSKSSSIEEVIDVDAQENFFITPVGCKGILRRKNERGLSMNPRLEMVLQSISSQWSHEKIESISRRQPRGRFSDAPKKEGDGLAISDLPLFKKSSP